MKNAALIVILLSFLAFFSCDLLEITRDYTYEIELTVNGSQTDFSTTRILDATSDSSEFDQYDHMIESAEITKIEYTVTYFNGADDQLIQTASLDLADIDGSDRQTLCTIKDVCISALSGSLRELPVNYSGMDRFKAMIEDEYYMAMVYFNGETNQTPVDFKIKFILTVTVKGQVI
jgi:hypothetical protein